jgi:hypothetical protein
MFTRLEVSLGIAVLTFAAVAGIGLSAVADGGTITPGRTDGAHEHPQYSDGINALSARADALEQRVAALEAPPPGPTLFGTTTFPPRAGRTEAQELQYLASTPVLGRPIDLRYSFSSSLPVSFATSPMAKDTGSWTSLWSFKASPDTVASGGLDAAWSTFLTTIPLDGKTRRIIYYQEPEDNMTAAQYTAAFDRLAALEDRDDVLLGENLKSWEFDLANSTANGADYIDDKADFVGISLFANSTDPNINRDALGRAAAAVEGKKIPFGLSSVGVSYQQSASKVASWFAYLEVFATAQRANGHPLDHVVCYSSNVTPATWTIQDWYMDGSATTLAGWREMVDALR